MPIEVPSVLLVFVALMVVAGLVMIRSARRFNRAVWGEGVCPNGACRARNKRHARFCARCGGKLRGD